MRDSTPSIRKVTILNVNDNEGARYMVTLMLKHSGFVVHEAATGRSALERAEELQPDVIVLDVRLPDIDGLEVCRRLRKNPQTASIKVLHTSATFVTLSKKVESLQGGADGYLTQPFEQQELVATIHSLVRLNRAEQELRDYAERLRKADKRKDEFLAMLAHELRNPLSALSAAFPLIERRPPEDPIEKRAREIVHRQLGQLARLIDDLLDVARVTQGKIRLKSELIDLAALLGRLIGVARDTKTGPRGQTLQATFHDGPVFVSGDPTRLEQVFSNLIDNASKYTDPGGTVHVTLSTAADGEAGLARISVRDNGVGIAPDAMPTIFQLFAQSNVSIARSRGGLGVGLTLVKTLVELHGGTVTARSDGMGQGSEFVVELPTSAGAQAGAPGDGPAVQPETLSQPRRILVVEDNPDVRSALVTLCELWGHEVTAVADGQSGMTQALQLRPDVCLIDIGLPVLDGYEVARRLRAEPHGRDLFLVALTGYGNAEQRSLALGAGFDMHIVKPVDATKLRLLLHYSAAAVARGAAAAPPGDRDPGAPG